MDQFPDEIIENIFSYLIDRRCHFGQDKVDFRTINQVRSVCRRFLNLEHYMVSNLVLGMCWTKKVYRLFLQDHPFWKKNLPYVHHLTFHYYKTLANSRIDLSILTHLKSLDICFGGLIEYIGHENLTQLKQIFCNRCDNISKLTKTNIHYHCCDWGDHGYFNYGDKCKFFGCLIRYANYPF